MRPAVSYIDAGVLADAASLDAPPPDAPRPDAAPIPDAGLAAAATNRDGCPTTIYNCHQGVLDGWVGRPASDVLRCQGADGRRDGSVITYFSYCSLDCDKAGTLTFRIARGKVVSATGTIKRTGAFCERRD